MNKLNLKRKIKLFYVITEENDSEEKDYDLEKSESDCDGNCDYYKALCKTNGLIVLIKEENFVLDLIDKISNPEKKREMLQNYLDSYKNKKQDLRFKRPSIII